MMSASNMPIHSTLSQNGLIVPCEKGDEISESCCRLGDVDDVAEHERINADEKTNLYEAAKDDDNTTTELPTDDSPITPPPPQQRRPFKDSFSSSAIIRTNGVVKQLFEKDFTPTNRGRVVSLDRGQDEHVLEMKQQHGISSPAAATEKTPITDDDENHHPLKSEKGGPGGFPDDESSGADTSDGESSYFAKHLPSPKSFRRYSLGSAPVTNTTANNNSASYYQNQSNRESDASLSLSDDSDDDEDVPSEKDDEPPKISPSSAKQQQQYTPSSNVQLFPLPGITRMHSYSSLVSSTSSDDERDSKLPVTAEYDRRKANSSGLSPVDSPTSSDDSTGTTSDNPSVRDELRSVAGGGAGGGGGPVAMMRLVHNNNNNNETTPTGRKSPVLGTSSSSQQQYQQQRQPSVTSGRFFAPFGSPSGNNPQPSPPPILPGYPPPPPSGMPHPQPQAMTSEQLTAWMAAGNAAANLVQQGYGSMFSNRNNNNRILPTSLHGIPTRQNGRQTSSEDGQQQQQRPNGMESGGGGGNNVQRMSSIGSDGTGGGGGAAFDRAYSWEEDEGGAMYDSGRSVPMPANYGSNPAELEGHDDNYDHHRGEFKVYWQRWLMLMYMSLLNLLSDWTCYSVAPISMLTEEAFGKFDPEQLVVIFLGANVFATAFEPIMLARLGLRGTVLFGSLLLMIGSIVKSGGMPPLWGGGFEKGQGEWRIQLGFFLVGLSQPLYQCTPALLSASWFPEKERTMATGVALNANQLGIGFAFIFGTLLVARSEDIVNYFGLLSILSTLAFFGTLLQFDDAPPTPPSDTAKVMRGTVGLPTVGSIFDTVRAFGVQREFDRRAASSSSLSPQNKTGSRDETTPAPLGGEDAGSRQRKSGSGTGLRREGSGSSSGRRVSRSRKTANKLAPPEQIRKTSSGLSAGSGGGSGSGGGGGNGGGGGQPRRRNSGQPRSVQTANTDSGIRTVVPGHSPSPSPAHSGSTRDVSHLIAELESQASRFGVHAPSPMMPGRVGPPPPSLIGQPPGVGDTGAFEENNNSDDPDQQGRLSLAAGMQPPYTMEPQFMMNPYAAQQGAVPMGHYYSHYNYAYWDPRYQHPAYYQYQGYYYYPPHDSYQVYAPPPYHPSMYSMNPGQAELPVSDFEDGAEPVVTVTNHHLDIHIRDDQVLLSARACLSRPGFVHALVAFTVSGIVINTLSTFMDYLVRLNGAKREYVGIVGGSFQFVIMISSLIIGTWTDKTRAYYSVTVAMLVMGAFGLAECGVSLNANRGGDVRWILIVVAALVGPLQPVSTELGVDVAYPLSENSVLVIQQLFSNLLSAMFIPIFKSLKDVGTIATDEETAAERPKYTFSFYLLIVLHATATVFFATFNGRYFRYEHEMEKKAREEQRRLDQSTAAFHPVRDNRFYAPQFGTEQQPLMDPNIRFDIAH